MPRAQVEVDFLVVVGVGGGDEGCGLDAEQVIFAHQPQNALAVDHHAAAAKLDGDTAITVATAVFQHDPLDGLAHFRILFAGVTLLEETVESGAADLGQSAHRLDT